MALLIHDFPHLKLNEDGEPESPKVDGGDDKVSSQSGHARSSSCTYSITLNGVAEVATGEFAERLRQIHLDANPSYKQFIERLPSSTDDEPSPAIVVVRIESARICNFKDQVEHWHKGDSVGSQESS